VEQTVYAKEEGITNDVGEAYSNFGIDWQEVKGEQNLFTRKRKAATG
jgi:hypothetical protein